MLNKLTTGLLGASLLAIGHFTHAADLPDFPFVIASGHAELKVKPDTATVYVQVLAFDQNSDKALSQLHRATSQIMEKLKVHGIALEQLEASDLRKETKRHRTDSNQTTEILGYEVSRDLIITLHDLRVYPELMRDLAFLDHTSSVFTLFDSNKRKEMERELSQVAGKNARENAEAAAKSLGSSVHSVYAISQSTNFNELFPGVGSYGSRQAMAFRYSDHEQLKLFAPETIDIQQSINVVFRLK